jgi:hypothetical protein
VFARIKWHQRTQGVDEIQFQRGKGQSLVEMALIAPLLVLLLIGVMEVGWALRGYIVLVNANREATRFAARGRYLDFGQTERDTVGYGRVLSHTLDSIAQQLPFDVVSGDPNGTLIVSHYLVDTGKPCADPPCNDDCDADQHNHHGGCDCSSPDRREEDYPYDDMVLHPGTPGYEHFTALYGIPRSSRISHDALVAQLKEENDALNCSINLRDPAVPWSVNSVVLVEAFYDQPQLLGVPIISNHFTDPVPLYTHTVMRISSDARDSTPTSEGTGCTLLPIAVHTNTLQSLDVGDPTGNIRNGTDSGDFGWLRWTDDTDAVSSDPNSEGYLAEEISNPRLAMNDYLEPTHKDPNDDVLNIGDWVWALTGNVNSNGVARDELDARIGQTHRFPVWDVAEGSGSNVVYHIVGFALIRIDGFDLTGNPKEIWGTFMGWNNGACRGNGH